jgi:hypothetical protein
VLLVAEGFINRSTSSCCSARSAYNARRGASDLLFRWRLRQRYRWCKHRFHNRRGCGIRCRGWCGHFGGCGRYLGDRFPLPVLLLSLPFPIYLPYRLFLPRLFFFLRQGRFFSRTGSSSSLSSMSAEALDNAVSSSTTIINEYSI